jgi:hypothetical protein
MGQAKGQRMRNYINPVADYIFTAFAGIDNCDYCDSFTHVNEWNRPDGGFVSVCNKCEYQMRFPEIRASL